MSHYRSNVRDQVFNLFEVLGVDKALGHGEFSDVDVDTARDMLAEVSRLAEGPVAESFVEGDRNPPVFDPKTHSVMLPESFKKSVNAMLEAGWDKVGIDEALGGMPMPKAVVWALHEHILAPIRRYGCTPSARASPRSSTTSAPRSRRSGRS